jgi:hypothetical protein
MKPASTTTSPPSSGAWLRIADGVVAPGLMEILGVKAHSSYLLKVPHSGWKTSSQLQSLKSAVLMARLAVRLARQSAKGHVVVLVGFADSGTQVMCRL